MAGYSFDITVGLNEGITQMFTDNMLNKTTNRFCDGYYDFKKIAQLLNYVFGTEVMTDAYFNSSGKLERIMNFYCPNLYNIINKKLTLSYYIDSNMSHKEFEPSTNADLKIEKDICKTLREQSFDECLELIINKLIVPWILKRKEPEEVKEQIKIILEIFNDDITLKNKVMYYLFKGYKNNDIENNELFPKKSKTDEAVSHIIKVNNNEGYRILSDGRIIQKKTGEVVPYDEHLYEYFYSKIIEKEDWNKIDFAFKNNYITNNVINLSISSEKNIQQRRKIMMAMKQYMKKNKLIVLNDLNFADNGSKFELNYINEKLTMNDIIYLTQNYNFHCLPGNNFNILQIIDKKTNKVVTSNSLINKCKIAYKISSLGLASMKYKEQWEQFSNIAEKQISKTGMIKKSLEYKNNPFLSLFNDAYGCEWFYNYMVKIPIEFNKISQELYLSENEMNLSMEQNELQNEELALIFSSFVENNTNTNSKKR